MIEIRDVSLLDLLPPNLLEDENVTACARAIDQQLQIMTQRAIKLPVMSRMDDLTDEEADRLAWEFSVGFYDAGLPIEQKRELVRNAIRWHRTKGTPAAVEELIAALFGDGKVEEWWEYGGSPGYFRVITNNEAVTNERAQEFLQAVNSVKRLTAMLEKVVLTQTERMQLYFGGALHIGEKMTIRQVK
ncbi:phage tail protein I [Paenibacillus alvei]|uniref:Phage tail protein I n=1 Tax=Paenibacillus alvei TaxID=44250 RepID=A0ABT4H8J2_PAEAL|nr:phage tail protein I [Paenibacillus alvei]MCY7486647.1 phage tail protein I [Paenibacillus alvei]MCY9764922.1 phage tail protein I [Paenibacillus alvei]MCY9771336.1 phage tail protein I [Paenibacillus alvei]